MICLVLQFVSSLLRLKCKYQISYISNVLINCPNIPRINIIYHFYCNLNKKLFTGWVKGHPWELYWTWTKRQILISSSLWPRLMVTNSREQMRIIKVCWQQKTRQKPSSCFPTTSASLLVEIKELFDILFNEFHCPSLLSIVVIISPPLSANIYKALSDYSGDSKAAQLSIISNISCRHSASKYSKSRRKKTTISRSNFQLTSPPSSLQGWDSVSHPEKEISAKERKSSHTARSLSDQV